MDHTRTSLLKVIINVSMLYQTRDQGQRLLELELLYNNSTKMTHFKVWNPLVWGSNAE